MKVSLATTLSHSNGGQFIVHAKALQGQALRWPHAWHGHSEIEKQIGVSLKRIFCDAGYKGHNAPQEHRFKVYTAGQKRKMTDAIKREMRRRAAIEPLIGHAKSDHRMGRNYLAGQAGDAINAILAAVGYNFRRLLAWLTLLLSAIWLTLLGTNRSHPDRVAA